MASSERSPLAGGSDREYPERPLKTPFAYVRDSCASLAKHRAGKTGLAVAVGGSVAALLIVTILVMILESGPAPAARTACLADASESEADAICTPTFANCRVRLARYELRGRGLDARGCSSARAPTRRSRCSAARAWASRSTPRSTSWWRACARHSPGPGEGLMTHRCRRASEWRELVHCVCTGHARSGALWGADDDTTHNA